MKKRTRPKKRILIVDDEPDMMEAIKFRLEESKYEVLMATDGEEGLKRAREEKPDLIILDLIIPKVNGYDICRKLKLDEKYKGIPIVMFTARHQPDDIRFGFAQGADAYVVKPFDPKILMGKISELLKKKRT